MIPDSSIDVIKGQMVALRVSYSTQLNFDISKNTILWNFISNKTQQVRFSFRVCICKLLII